MKIKEKLEKKYLNFLQLVKYVDLIEAKNEVMNLTGFKGSRLWVEGIYESIVCLENLSKGKLLDIGAGAGFPSVPWAIVNPKITVSIYEPLLKRTKFLNLVKKTLHLTNLTIFNKRIEETEEEEIYDYVTARAVASLKILVEISHKPLKVGGQMIFIKGPNLEEELKEAIPLIKRLNLTWEIIPQKILKKEVKIIKLIKCKSTPPGIPRRWSQIKKRRNNGQI